MNRLDRLVALLDGQIDNLRGKLSVLQRMAECVRQGDAVGLDGLLQEEAELEAGANGLERQIADARQELATLMEAPAEQVTLGRLAQSLDGPIALELSDRRERLLVTVAKVREASAYLNRLVRHAMEFNEQIVAAIAGERSDTCTYSSCGEKERGSALTTFRHTV